MQNLFSNFQKHSSGSKKIFNAGTKYYRKYNEFVRELIRKKSKKILIPDSLKTCILEFIAIMPANGE